MRNHSSPSTQPAAGFAHKLKAVLSLRDRTRELEGTPLKSRSTDGAATRTFETSGSLFVLFFIRTATSKTP